MPGCSCGKNAGHSGFLDLTQRQVPSHCSGRGAAVWIDCPTRRHRKSLGAGVEWDADALILQSGVWIRDSGARLEGGTCFQSHSEMGQTLPQPGSFPQARLPRVYLARQAGRYSEWMRCSPCLQGPQCHRKEDRKESARHHAGPSTGRSPVILPVTHPWQWIISFVLK